MVPTWMTIAKSLAGGVPLSAVTGKAEIMDAPHRAAWAAPTRAIRSRSPQRHAVIDIMAEERLLERRRPCSASG